MKSEHNIADISTRLYFKEPIEIPWFKGDIKVDERFHTLPVSQNVANLPDVKKQEVTVQNVACKEVLDKYPLMTLQNLLTVKLPLYLKTPPERQNQNLFKEVDEILTRNELKKATNVIARILQRFGKNETKIENFCDFQEKARKLIVCAYQSENQDYVRSVGGNIFSKITSENELEPTVLQVRENKLGKEFLYLIPKKCLLFKKVIEHFHKFKSYFESHTETPI